MRVVDFAETLRELLEDKINQSRSDIEEYPISHSRIDADGLMIQIQAREWVQGQIHDLVINKERKDKIEHRDT
jgi:hypothetical protein